MPASATCAVIADEFQEGVPGYYTDKYWVRKDSGINKVEDLKGKVVGTNAGGSAVDVAIRAMLRKHGLEPNRDYTFLEGPLPAMPAMLLAKKADLIPAVLPFALNPKLKAGAKPLFTQADATGKTDMIIICARKSFINAHRAAMVDFMEDMLRVVHWYLDPKNHAEVAEIADKLTKAPAELLRLAVHQERQLPRSQHDAGPEGAAEQCRHGQGARLHQEARRHQQAQRSQSAEGSAGAA